MTQTFSLSNDCSVLPPAPAGDRASTHESLTGRTPYPNQTGGGVALSSGLWGSRHFRKGLTYLGVVPFRLEVAHGSVYTRSLLFGCKVLKLSESALAAVWLRDVWLCVLGFLLFNSEIAQLLSIHILQSLSRDQKLTRTHGQKASAPPLCHSRWMDCLGLAHSCTGVAVQ